MPGYRSRLRRRRPASDRRAEALPAQRRRRAAGVRPARRGRRVGRRGARRRRARRATAPSATSLLPALRGGRAAPRGRRRDVLPLAARCRRRRAPSEACAAAPARAAASSSRPARYFGAGGAGYVRVALVPDARARAERAAARLSWPLACSAALSPPQRPAARQRLDRARRRCCAGTAGPTAPESSRALTTSPSGSVTRVPAVM